ncbi:MAG: aminotransferase class V-fold PLP-dependent enzyme [Clostridia bacterium]|nr:aminotransferase class V-fold PLP-dependent enzyme [Clostridia bacterium]
MRDCEVYADCAASAPVLKIAWDVMSKAYAEGWGNPNSVHTAGRDARKKLEEAREIIAHCINAEPSEIAFTPSATAACTFAISTFGVAFCSAYEHKAVTDTAHFQMCYGNVTDNAYAHMLANNETGEIYRGKVRELSRDYAVFTDATAAVGQITVDVQNLGVQSLAAGAHKFGGYPGIGFLYVRGGVKDDDTFPGTPPVALAVAMAEALKYRTEHMDTANAYLAEQCSLLMDRIMEIPGAHFTVGKESFLHLANILSVRFDGVNARELLTMLDVNGVYASAGSACTADQDEPSRTLLASGLTREQALSTIRLSFCPETTREEFDFVAETLRLCVARVRALNRAHTL